MSTCDRCGGAIEFRYIGGRPIPLHVSGSCLGGGGGFRSSSAGPFRTVESYVNPNAHCPVCGKPVFFYQSPYGGRVFFDDLGWPWPKHPCTDNPKSQTGSIRWRVSQSFAPFKAAGGQPLELYELTSVTVKAGIVEMRFSLAGKPRSFGAALSVNALHLRGITVSDLQQATSFVVQTYSDHRIIEFISWRRQQIVGFKAQRQKKP